MRHSITTRSLLAAIERTRRDEAARRWAESMRAHGGEPAGGTSLPVPPPGGYRAPAR